MLYLHRPSRTDFEGDEYSDEADDDEDDSGYHDEHPRVVVSAWLCNKNKHQATSTSQLMTSHSSDLIQDFQDSTIFWAQFIYLIFACDRHVQSSLFRPTFSKASRKCTYVAFKTCVWNILLKFWLVFSIQVLKWPFTMWKKEISRNKNKKLRINSWGPVRMSLSWGPVRMSLRDMVSEFQVASTLKYNRGHVHSEGSSIIQNQTSVCF